MKWVPRRVKAATEVQKVGGSRQNGEDRIGTGAITRLHAGARR